MALAWTLSIVTPRMVLKIHVTWSCHQLCLTIPEKSLTQKEEDTGAPERRKWVLSLGSSPLLIWYPGTGESAWNMQLSRPKLRIRCCVYHLHRFP